MLGRLSRTSSQSSLNEGDNINPHSSNQANKSAALDQISMLELDPSLAASIRFTKEHPIGAILIKLAQDNTALAKKSNLRGVETNIHDLCTSFHTAIQFDKDDMNNKLIKSHKDIENAIISKDLNSHKLNSDVNPPNYFSSVPTITSPSKLTEVLKIFPRNLKFSGLKQDNHMSITEFLNTLRTAQEQLRLSEPEFIDRMLACSTGLAHELIFEWRANGENIPTIYHNLLINFDKRLAPEEAKQQLNAYKIPKTGCLAKAEAQIMILAGRTASALPEGPSRTAYYNLEACNSIIRALPPTSSSNVNNLYNKISARLGRAATFAELSRGMNLYRTSYDKDIKLNGSDNTFRANKRITSSNMRSSAIQRPKYMAYHNSASTNNYRQSETNRYRYPRNNKSRAYINETSFTPKPLNLAKPLLHSANHKETWNSTKTQNGPERSMPKRGANGKFQRNMASYSSSCSLCGMKNHSSPECKNMQSDDGRRVDIIPTYGTCSRCPARVHPRLHHPETICPFRTGGPLQENSNL